MLNGAYTWARACGFHRAYFAKERLSSGSDLPAPCPGSSAIPDNGPGPRCANSERRGARCHHIRATCRQMAFTKVSGEVEILRRKATSSPVKRHPIRHRRTGVPRLSTCHRLQVWVQAFAAINSHILLHSAAINALNHSPFRPRIVGTPTFRLCAVESLGPDFIGMTKK